MLNLRLFQIKSLLARRFILIPILLVGMAFALMWGGVAAGANSTLQIPGNPKPDPSPNTVDASRTADVSISYDEAILSTTVDSTTFPVYGMQTGQLLGMYSVDGITITFNPDLPFQPGEIVQATATTGTLTLSAEGPLTPTVWSFRAGVAFGGGTLTDSGQMLGNENSRDVALGDLDGDGDLDAFVANTANQPNQVWINDGQGTFTNTGQLLGDFFTTRIALGDLDGDGDLDAFHANTTQNQVWLNDGTAVFTHTGQLLGNSNSRGVALGDLDGDGDLDAFVANNSSQPNVVWLNDGSGLFTENGQTLSSINSNAVELGDLDGDFDLDAVVSDNQNHPGQILFNNGKAIFTETSQSQKTTNSRDIALGDLDGDGDLDIFAVTEGVTNTVWYNDGTGFFTDSGQTLGDGLSSDVDLGDLDGDGDLDAFIAAYDLVFSNTIWLNDGGGFFADSGQNPGYSTQGVALGDLDGDGDLDAFTANNSSVNGRTLLDIVVPISNKVWLNDPQLTAPVDLSLTKSSLAEGSLVAGDRLTYILTATNTTTATATGVRIEDTLPAEGVFLGASQGCTEEMGIVTCNLGTILGNASRTVSITIEAWSLTDTITNTAIVSADGSDLDPSNNTASYSIPIEIEADLALDVTDDAPMEVTAGTTFTYTLSLLNIGPARAYQVTVFDDLPDGIQFDSITIIELEPEGKQIECIDQDGSVICDLGNIGLESDHLPERSHILRFGMRVVVTEPGANPDDNRVSVDSSSPDPDQTNNEKVTYKAYLPLIDR